MKVVIKGDKNTGKTCLFRRLQRLAFVEDYISTDQIQIATIPWDYKVSNDKIKVEVWDVVDRARAKKKEEVDGLKTTNTAEAQLDDSDGDDLDADAVIAALPKLSDGIQSGAFSMGKLDAQSVDVYKDVNAVLFVIDPRKKWTLDYVDRELPEVPKNTFVLILANYRDCPQNQRVITEYELQEYARNAGKYVRYLECSMKNCYGMKGIGCFFNLPFLKIKRQYILQQLKENEADLDAADQEYVLIATEQNYQFYLKWLEENKKSRKAQAPSALPDGPPLRAPSQTGTTTASSGAAVSTAAPSGTPATTAPATTVTGALDSMKRFVATSLGTETAPEASKTPSPTLSAQPKAQPSTGAPQPKPTAKTQQQQPQQQAATSTTVTPQPKPKPKPIPAQAQTPQPKAPAPPAEPTSGLSSWTARLWGAKAEPAPKKPPPPDVEGDLKRVIAHSKETGTVGADGAIDDFTPATEGDADFWKVEDSDEEVKPSKKGAKPVKKKDTFSTSSDDDTGPSFAMMQDETPDFPEVSAPVVTTPVRAKPKPKTLEAPTKPAVEAARSAPVTPVKQSPKQATIPEQPKPAPKSKKQEEREETRDDSDGNGYDEFFDKSSDDEDKEDEAEKEARLKRERKELEKKKSNAKSPKKRFTILQDQDPFANDPPVVHSPSIGSAPASPSPLYSTTNSPGNMTASYGDLPDATNGNDSGSKRRSSRHRDRSETSGERRRHRDRPADGSGSGGGSSSGSLSVGRERKHRERRAQTEGTGSQTPEGRKHRPRKDRPSRTTDATPAPDSP
eukprot:TRINITY_DN2414_c0_g1_i1.p1 TRINITY_DN2414_c0_g1~~TRINITY_DN2414_c0_g1_i1.p1  ORF type:complete len:860 (-),score=196.31 TRINITY_DN2414_c0_g1_i1:13-2379(-)